MSRQSITLCPRAWFLPILLAGSLHAGDGIQRIGDVLAVAIPLTALGATLYQQDKAGQYQFFQSFGTSMLSTMTLKYTVREKRPDTTARDSFPSGHTSSAFAGASFIHRRYGLQYALLPYLGALFTGYSRIHAHRHYTRDVIAGAAIGIAASYWLVRPYHGVRVTPEVDAGHIGVRVRYAW